LAAPTLGQESIRGREADLQKKPQFTSKGTWKERSRGVEDGKFKNLSNLGEERGDWKEVGCPSNLEKLIYSSV